MYSVGVLLACSRSGSESHSTVSRIWSDGPFEAASDWGDGEKAAVMFKERMVSLREWSWMSHFYSGDNQQGASFLLATGLSLSRTIQEPQDQSWLASTLFHKILLSFNRVAIGCNVHVELWSQLGRASQRENGWHWQLFTHFQMHRHSHVFWHFTCAGSIPIQVISAPMKCGKVWITNIHTASSNAHIRQGLKCLHIWCQARSF